MLSLFVQRTLTSCILIALFTLLCYLPPLIFSLLLAAILASILHYEWPRLCPYAGYPGFLITLFYPIAPFALMIYMNEYYHTPYIQMLMIVASFDAGAYVIGSLCGAHPLLPRISPGKTWEGVGGGLLCAAVTLFLLKTYYANFTNITFPLLLALCTTALVGDLFESWLKRRAGVKDSAQILPGHGGFLDRFDSHMAAIVLLYAVRRWL
jgi:phosphatidate cytidylyltransferase